MYTLFMLLMILLGALGEQPQVGIKTNTVTIGTCRENEYLYNSKCKPCSICSDFEFVKTKCNSTQDTVCECTPGFYLDKTDGQCKECTKCRVGWGASPACTSTSNTVCVVCPHGSYSNVESSTKSCQSCTLCDQRNEFILRECTTQRDTTCFKVRQQTSDPEFLGNSETCDDGGCKSTKDNTYLYTAPLYCAGLGAIIFGLLVYVVIRCRKNKKRATQLAAGNQKQAIGYPVVQQTPLNNQPNYYSSFPIVYLQHDGKTVTVTASTKYRDLPSTIRRTVSRCLSHDGSWLKLAHNLGFTPSEISQIQQKAEHDCKGTSAASVLLSEWTRKDLSNVGVIIHALASINRIDLVNLIYNSNSMKGSEVV